MLSSFILIIANNINKYRKGNRELLYNIVLYCKKDPRGVESIPFIDFRIIRPEPYATSTNTDQDREKGGDEGDSWPRMFMSDAATAFAALALLPSDRSPNPK